jgi:hypothetical protein
MSASVQTFAPGATMHGAMRRSGLRGEERHGLHVIVWRTAVFACVLASMHARRCAASFRMLLLFPEPANRRRCGALSRGRWRSLVLWIVRRACPRGHDAFLHERIRRPGSMGLYLAACRASPVRSFSSQALLISYAACSRTADRMASEMTSTSRSSPENRRAQ